MRATPRIALLLTVAVATVAFAFAPAGAVDDTVGATFAAQEEPAEAPDEEAPSGAESEKIQLPLDIESPYGVFGAFLLLCVFIAGAVAVRNAAVQTKGGRPQADGSWRPR